MPDLMNRAGQGAWKAVRNDPYGLGQGPEYQNDRGLLIRVDGAIDNVGVLSGLWSDIAAEDLLVTSEV